MSINPQYPYKPIFSTEDLKSYSINSAGDRLLVRTAQHDYEFELPPNHINEIITYAPIATKLGNWSLSELNVSATGKASITLSGEYGPNVNGVPFPPEGVAKFKEFGFGKAQTVDETADFFPVYTHLSSLEGQQYFARDKDTFSGTNIFDNRYPSIAVFTLNEERTKNNKINELLSPLFAIKNAI